MKKSLNERIQVRVTKEMFARLQTQADSVGLTVSALCRATLVRYLLDSPPTTEPPNWHERDEDE